MSYDSSFTVPLDPRQVVLATLGDSDQSRFVVATAVRLVRELPRASVHLVHVLPAMVADAEDPRASFVRALAQERLTSCAEAMRRVLERDVSTHLEVGEVATTIVSLAGSLGADLIVIGASDTTPLRRAVFGSVADHVLHHAPCNVLLARPKL